MGFLDFFKTNEFKQTIEEQQNKISEYEALLTPEMRDIIKAREVLKDAQKQIDDAQIELDKKLAQVESVIPTLQEKISLLNTEISNLNKEISNKKGEIIVLDNQILLQEFGLYTPVYNFTTSEEYKNRLEVVRTKQKDMVKNDTAATYSTTWTVNNSVSQGKKWLRTMLSKFSVHLIMNAKL